MEGSVFPYKRWPLTKAHLYINSTGTQMGTGGGGHIQLR